MILKQIKTNFTMVDMGSYTVWFSYETPIAYKLENVVFVSKNRWSKTTGIHINTVKKLFPNYIEVEDIELHLKQKQI